MTLCSPSDYALAHIVNPETGRRLDFVSHAYLLKPLNDLGPRVVIQKGAQVGATVLAMARALWFVEKREAHTLYLFPTHRSAQRFSRGRLATLLDSSQHLQTLFKGGRSIGHLRAGRVNLYCHGARSRAELMSTPAQSLIIDERDEMYQADAYGRQPWSAVELARQRLAGQEVWWELSVSTPTLPGHGIAADYAASNQQVFLMPCPRCGRRVTLSWPESVSWSEADDDRIPATYCCSVCKGCWREEERREAVGAGEWVAQRVGRHRGYHVPRLLAPALPAPRLVDEWRKAQTGAGLMQVFHNAVLGLPYLPEGGRLQRHELESAQAASPFRMAENSEAVCVLGADVGPTWLHMVVVELGSGRPRVVWIGKTPAWNTLADLVRRFKVRSFVLDAQPETHLARKFVREFHQGLLCYYHGAGEPVVDAATKTVTASRTGTLDALYSKLRMGELLLPLDAPAEFIQHLESLVRVLRRGRDGELHAEYHETGGPDHYAHALNYALLAANVLTRPLTFQVTKPRGMELAWE